MSTLACDISYYQDGVDDSYPHPWLIFRLADGTFIDPRFSHNYGWSCGAADKGKLKGFTVYLVFRPGIDALTTLKQYISKPHPKMTVMLDVENWNGQITGNHSAEITRQLEAIAEWLGDRDRVLAYANQGDFANLFPQRPSWLHLVVAGYGSIQPVYTNMIGWQYSDGQDRWPVPYGYPRSSAPFGRCDHNVFPFHDPDELATALGVGDDMALTADDISKIAEAAANAVWAERRADSDGNEWQMGTYVVNTRHNTAGIIAALVQVANAVAAVSSKVDGVTKALTTSGTGVLARVAAVQAAVTKVAQPVISVDPATVAGSVSDAVIAKVQSLTFGVK